MKRTSLKRKTPLKRGGKLRPFSKKRAKQNRKYLAERENYFTHKSACEICGARATQIHHKKGRAGDRLFDSEFFMAICYDCHHKIHQNPKWAYENGYMVQR